MIDIKNYNCIVCKNKLPIFGNINDKVAKYCNTCKLDGMIDIKHPKCITCKITRPVFGNINDKIAKYCYLCKLDGMIDIHTTKCVVCQNKIPSFGLPNDKKPKYCSSCKLDGMVDIKNPKCIICKITRPYFGLPNDKIANYCNTCKLDGMTNMIDPKCKSEWCNTIITKKYDGYCAYCYMHLFPDKPLTRNYKTKELAVSQFIKNNFTNIDIITDKIIQSGCSRRRPDILIDLGEQIIIIEIDENQHTDYDSTCENKRIMELSQDVNHRPIVFIRFNPDDYKTVLGNITSCWGINKNGICTIKKTKEIEWKERLNKLKNTIEFWIENKTEKTIKIVQLYYDE